MLATNYGDQLDIGVIGCGTHLLNAHILPPTNPVEEESLCVSGVYDPASLQLELLQQRIGRPVRSFSSEGGLLSSDIAAVMIASPDRFHAASTLQAVRAGKHVFVEKPLATSDGEVHLAIDAIKEAQERDLHILICHPKRFDPPYLWVKNNLPELVRKFGPVTAFHFNLYVAEGAFDLQDRLSWKYRRSLMVDHVSHQIDLVHFLLGHSETELAVYQNNGHAYQLAGTRADGIRLSLAGGPQAALSAADELLELEFGSITLELEARRGRANLLFEGCPDDALAIAPIDFSLRSRRITEHFANVVLGREAPYLEPVDLLASTLAPASLEANGEWRFNPERIL